MAAGLCSDKDEARCFEEYGEEGRKWACSRCKKSRWTDLDPYTHKLMQLAALQRAGYPLAKDDLTVDEWLDLGRVKMVTDSRKYAKE